MKRIVERANAEITYSVREEERSNPVTVTFTEWGLKNATNKISIHEVNNSFSSILEIRLFSI